MKRPTDKEIEASLVKLRALCEGCIVDDPVKGRLAQAMEYALRWSREETHDWHSPEEEVELVAAILKGEVGS